MVEEKVFELLKDMSARLDRIERKIGGNIISKDSLKKRIVKVVNDRGSITVNQVMSELGISRPYSLEVMKGVEKLSDNIILIPGNPRNPSKLQKVDVKNKLEYVPLLIIKDMKGIKGKTKLVGAVMKQYCLSDSEMRMIIGSVVKITSGKISLVSDGKDLVNKRFKNWRLE